MSGSNFHSHTQNEISFLKNRALIRGLYKEQNEVHFPNSLFKPQSTLIAVLIALICMLGLSTDGHVTLPRISRKEGLSLLSAKFLSDVHTSLFISEYGISSHKNLQVPFYLLCFVDEETRVQISQLICPRLYN